MLLDKPAWLNCDGVRALTVVVPSFINLVSMDTEGIEDKVLSAWPWSTFKVTVFIVENEGNSRKAGLVCAILKREGYLLTPTQGAGVHEYWVLPGYWELAKKEYPNTPSWEPQVLRRSVQQARTACYTSSLALI